MQRVATTSFALRRLTLSFPRTTAPGSHGHRQRGFACTSQAEPLRNAPDKRSAQSIMNMASNKATRFVYLRTLPLVKQPELEGDVDSVATSIEAATETLCNKHSGTIKDDRTAVHLHTAALAIATHRVLSPLIKNEIRLSNIIRSGYGAALLPEPNAAEGEAGQLMAKEKLRPDFWIVRAALWFSFDRMNAIRKMTANMARDFGASFETKAVDEEKDGRRQHTLFVSKFCLFSEFMHCEDNINNIT